MPNLACPRCGDQTNQTKAGIHDGRQQYRCAQCGRRYLIDQKERGLGESKRNKAARLRAEGHTYREIAALLGVTVRTLTNWFREAPSTDEPPTTSLDPETDETSETATVLPTVATEEGNPTAPSIPTSIRRRATIQDVAEKVGVAVSTVSNFLNNKGSIAPGTRARIQAAIEELHFTPNAMMRAIRNRRSRIIGVLNYGAQLDEDGDVTDYSCGSRIALGIEETAGAARHNLLMYTHWWTPSLDGVAPILDGHIDGLLIAGPRFKDPNLELGAAAGLPVVAMLSRHVPPNVGFVNTDNIGAMHMIVEHLASLGKRRIGSVIATYDSNHLDRYNGLREALGAFNLPFDNALVKQISGTPWPEHNKLMENALRKLMDSAGRLDAIVAPDDYWARWTLNALKERGIRVPEDISVVGFDDAKFATTSGLTTIRQPFRKIGQVAAQTLLKLIEGAPISECQITLPGELIVRSSTVPAS